MTFSAAVNFINDVLGRGVSGDSALSTSLTFKEQDDLNLHRSCSLLRNEKVISKGHGAVVFFSARKY